MRLIRRLLLVALATLLSPALVACGDDKEQDSASAKAATTLKGDGFSVEMPGKPERRVLSAPTPAGPVPITSYLTQDGEEGFSMSVLKIPKGARFDLDGAVRGAAANVKGTVGDNAKTSYEGFPARDARITNAADENGNKGTVFARMILTEDRFFQLQFVKEGADVKSPPAAYKRFVSSLKIG